MNIADLYEEYSERLTRYAISLSHSLDRADDLVQETFVRALGHSQQLQGMNRFQQEAWLKRVLRNRFFDEQRTNQRQLQLGRQLTAQLRRRDSAARLPSFDEVIDLVPQEHRDVFDRRYRLGMNSSEIAQDLGISSGTVRYWLHQTIQCLREQIPQQP